MIIDNLYERAGQYHAYPRMRLANGSLISPVTHSPSILCIGGPIALYRLRHRSATVQTVQCCSPVEPTSVG